MAMPQSNNGDKPRREVPNCVAGDAQVFIDKVIDMHYPHRTTEFLLKGLRKGTFDSYGYHQKAGTDEHTCPFHLATWSRMLGWRKPNILQVRDRLVTAKVIWFEPDPEEPGYGRIGWNCNLDEWQPIGPQGGRRVGAGNPYFVDSEYQAIITRLKVKQHTDQPPNNYQSSNAELSKKKRLPDKTTINLVTPVSYGAKADEVSSDPLRKVTEERSKNPDANASDGAEAPVASRVPPQKNTKAPRTASTAPRKTDDPAWLAVNNVGFELLAGYYPTTGYNHDKEAGALWKLFKTYHVRDPAELRDVWEATLLDPRWETDQLSMVWIERIIGTYRRNVEGYRKGMHVKREKHERSTTNGKNTPQRRSASSPLQALNGPYSSRDDPF